MFWYGQKASLELDRGPWTDSVRYLQAIAQKEIIWTEKYGKPTKPDFPHNMLEFGEQQPAEYVQLLKDYLSLAPHLLPQEHTHSFHRPTIRHPDLTSSNIFIDPATGFISSLIDWQHALIEPLGIAAGITRTFESADTSYSPRIDEPQLPEDLDTLSAEEQAEARATYRKLLLYHCYRVLASNFNPLHHTALLDRTLTLRKWIVDYAGHLWTGDNVKLRGAIIGIVRHWHLLPDTKDKPCPIHFDEAELARFNEREEQWTQMNTLLAHYRSRVCWMNVEGRVENEDFERAQEEHRKLKEELLADCDDAEEKRLLNITWPFRDRDEED
jgi:hypothetical protein